MGTYTIMRTAEFNARELELKGNSRLKGLAARPRKRPILKIQVRPPDLRARQSELAPELSE